MQQPSGRFAEKRVAISKHLANTAFIRLNGEDPLAETSEVATPYRELIDHIYTTHAPLLGNAGDVIEKVRLSWEKTVQAERARAAQEPKGVFERIKGLIVGNGESNACAVPPMPASPMGMVAATAITDAEFRENMQALRDACGMAATAGRQTSRLDGCLAEAGKSATDGKQVTVTMVRLPADIKAVVTDLVEGLVASRLPDGPEKTGLRARLAALPEVPVLTPDDVAARLAARGIDKAVSLRVSDAPVPTPHEGTPARTGMSERLAMLRQRMDDPVQNAESPDTKPA